jgi:hypothetical protein
MAYGVLKWGLLCESNGDTGRGNEYIYRVAEMVRQLSITTDVVLESVFKMLAGCPDDLVTFSFNMTLEIISNG